MKIYTKTGDAGETSLYRGGRIPKDAPRIEACGAVDELNCILGLVCSNHPAGSGTAGDAIGPPHLLERVQHDLFLIGADLATPAEAVKAGDDVTRLAAGSEAFIESAIDDLERELTPLQRFILPGGCPEAAQLHLARAVCRRAERAVVKLGRGESVSPPVPVYLNRLSDLLFVLARTANSRAGVADIPWER